MIAVTAVLLSFLCGHAAPGRVAASELLPDVVVTDLDRLWVFPGAEGGELARPTSLMVESCAADCVEPWHVATGDVDGDGLEDVVSANRHGPHVSVHLGEGDGVFEAARIFPTAERPYDVDLADLDGDGDLDLVVTCNNNPGPVEIRLNDGSGSFDDVDPLTINGEPFNTEVADFDGDGVPDLAVTLNDDDEVLVFTGDGEGGFTPVSSVAAGDDPKAIRSGRFDDDETLDLVITNYTPGAVTVFLGDGEGGFAMSRRYSTGGLPREIAVADLDGDGFDDFVVAAGRGTDYVSVFLNEGAGGKGVFDGPENHVTGPRPNSVAAADFDSDGFPDVVVANWSLDDPSRATVSLLIGDGEGGFSEKKDFVVDGGFRKLTALAVGQFDSLPFEFIRGDANLDGSVNVSDPVAVLRYLFSGAELACLDPADANDNGKIELPDAIIILLWLFQQGRPLADPFPEAGVDPTSDDLPCLP